jgi:hypothetical protein
LSILSFCRVLIRRLEKEVQGGKPEVNIAMTCPFSKKACTDCVLYRGRHHYLSLSKPHGVVAIRPKKLARSGLPSLSDDFELLEKSSEPWSGQYGDVRNEPKIRLKVIDVENRGERICSLSEARKWDWTNPRIWRVIDGRQIKSSEDLIDILCHKAEAGAEEAELYEAPRFFFLAGG